MAPIRQYKLGCQVHWRQCLGLHHTEFGNVISSAKHRSIGAKQTFIAEILVNG